MNPFFVMSYVRPVHFSSSALLSYLDLDYTGTIKLLLYNFGDKDFEIQNPNKIAQLILEHYETMKQATNTVAFTMNLSQPLYLTTVKI